VCVCAPRDSHTNQRNDESISQRFNLQTCIRRTDDVQDSGGMICLSQVPNESRRWQTSVVGGRMSEHIPAIVLVQRPLRYKDRKGQGSLHLIYNSGGKLS